MLAGIDNRPAFVECKKKTGPTDGSFVSEKYKSFQPSSAQSKLPSLRLNQTTQTFLSFSPTCVFIHAVLSMHL